MFFAPSAGSDIADQQHSSAKAVWEWDRGTVCSWYKRARPVGLAAGIVGFVPSPSGKEKNEELEAHIW